MLFILLLFVFVFVFYKIRHVRLIILSIVLSTFKLYRKCKRTYDHDNVAELQRLKIPSTLKSDQTIVLSFVASDRLGNAISVKFQRFCSKTVATSLVLYFEDGKVLRTPLHEKPVIDETGSNEDENYMAANGLRIQVIDPARTFRILFDGLLFDGTDYVEVNLRLWFQSLADPAELNFEYSPLAMASKIATAQENCWQILKNFVNDETIVIEQFGEIRGTISCGSAKPIALSLNGVRGLAKRHEARQAASFFAIKFRLERGMVFTLNMEESNVFGIVSYQTGYVYPVSWSDCDWTEFAANKSIPRSFCLKLIARGRKYDFDVRLNSSSNHYFGRYKVLEHGIKVEAGDGQVGYGFIELGFIDSSRELNDCLKMNLAPKDRDLENLSFCLHFDHPSCQLANVTGGKASKLADMIASTDEGDFKIPRGFAITVLAYSSHLKANPNVENAIKDLLGLSKARSQTANLQKACENVQEAFSRSELESKLRDEIEHHLRLSFTDSRTKLFAVRSSAVVEDGQECSGAGQAESFLNRNSLDSIFEAVKLCWASNFSWRAFRYRRQMCIALDSPMAVIVQAMAKAEKSGVLFTRHPDTGSPSCCLINATMGLGDDLVSGRIHPETVVIRRKDPFNEDDIEINLEGEKSCLTELEIKRLYKVGRVAERIFGSARDLEFAVTEASKIYILQARPITTCDLESEWELLHEFDGPLASDREWITTANVQEMMPGALAPLCARTWLSTIGGPLENSQMRMHLKPRRRFETRRCVLIQCNHVFMNMTMIGASLCDKFVKASADMGLFGRLAPELLLSDYIEQNDMTSSFWRFFVTFHTWFTKIFPGPGMEALVPLIENYQEAEINDPAELYRHIKHELLPFNIQVWLEHIRITYWATVYPVLMMNIMDSSMNWGPQMYEDMATLLSSCENVHSADVPTLLQEIAESIRSDPEGLYYFTCLDRQDAAEWLLEEDRSGRHGKLFKSFMQKHGHRCIRDSDLREKSWNEEPEKLVDALRVILSNLDLSNKANLVIKKDFSIAEALNAIKTPIDLKRRLLLRFLLPKARATVGRREWAKSHAIKVTDYLRRAYSRLAAMLTERGVLPDEDLMFFLSPEEIEGLLHKRSPKLIAKALRRRKLLPKHFGMQFSELVNGHAYPIKIESNEAMGNLSSLTIKGMAVGNGFVKGRARVVTTLADANLIENGDILVVPYTDVGWTPYFPLLAGIVTELGGLISHGAVIAREYGLPCLVGCKRATSLIRTGDYVTIDSRRGEIQVVFKRHENSG